MNSAMIAVALSLRLSNPHTAAATLPQSNSVEYITFTTGTTIVADQRARGEVAANVQADVVEGGQR